MSRAVHLLFILLAAFVLAFSLAGICAPPPTDATLAQESSFQTASATINGNVLFPVRVRSPLTTAVVTSAMLRTWLVRLPAMKLTESVRSFQVPPTPLTSA